ncbi:hypothetical protein SR1949_38100 [Sphaerospermopsis reniformis]|uniref:Uncharacterized protein n=1 Tax=Sphaerospermopsis reniformis TaxID=531300 RepID=A0A480A2G9_9CYAN|nr:hypothetical protein SR1949_38100 [Sphaerospermopsis reniformis]
MVVILPFNDVVPPAFVSKLAAVTVLNVVVAALLAIIFPTAVVLTRVIFPVKALTVKLPLTLLFPNVILFASCKLTLFPVNTLT